MSLHPTGSKVLAEGIIELIKAVFTLFITSTFWVWLASILKGQTFGGALNKLWSNVIIFFNLKAPVWIYLLTLFAVYIVYVIRLRIRNRKNQQNTVHGDKDNLETANLGELTQPPGNVFTMKDGNSGNYHGYGSRNWDDQKKQPIGKLEMVDLNLKMVF